MTPHSLWLVRGYILGITLIVLAMCVGLGALADYLFDTWPRYALIGLVISFPLANIAAISLVRRRFLTRS